MGTYIEKLAHTLMGQLKIEGPEAFPNFLDSSSWSPQQVYFACNEKIRGWLNNKDGETLGRIAYCGRSVEEALPQHQTPLLEVLHRSLNLGDGGRQLLIDIATRAIIAEMFDIMQRRRAHSRAVCGND